MVKEKNSRLRTDPCGTPHHCLASKLVSKSLFHHPSVHPPIHQPSHVHCNADILFFSFIKKKCLTGRQGSQRHAERLPGSLSSTVGKKRFLFDISRSQTAELHYSPAVSVDRVWQTPQTHRGDQGHSGWPWS